MRARGIWSGGPSLLLRGPRSGVGIVGGSTGREAKTNEPRVDGTLLTTLYHNGILGVRGPKGTLREKQQGESAPVQLTRA